MKFKRFPEEKQKQVEQLVAYAQLMGLSGKDLISIGGKIDRQDRRHRVESNKEIVKSFQCLPIGRDRLSNFDNRFKLKTIGGAYNFYAHGYMGWFCVSVRTKVKCQFSVDGYAYDLPRTDWKTRQRYALLLDIANGKIKLNF